MATFCYRTKNGILVEKIYPCGKAPESVEHEGEVAYRSYKDELGDYKKVGDIWPLECDASGVHPSQAKDLKELLKKNGVPTEVTTEGNPVYRSPQHRREALKVRGIKDRNSYY